MQFSFTPDVFAGLVWTVVFMGLMGMAVLTRLSIWEESANNKITEEGEEMSNSKGMDIPMSFICCGNDYNVHIEPEDLPANPEFVRQAAELAHAQESPGCLNED